MDNKGTILISENPIVKITKNIVMMYHKIRQLVRYGIVIVKYITSDYNLLDIFTKIHVEDSDVNNCKLYWLVIVLNIDI